MSTADPRDHRGAGSSSWLRAVVDEADEPVRKILLPADLLGQLARRQKPLPMISTPFLEMRCVCHPVET